MIEATSESVKFASSSSRSVPSMNSKTSIARSFGRSRKRKARSVAAFSAKISAMSAGSIVLRSSLRLLNCFRSKSLSTLARNFFCRSIHDASLSPERHNTASSPSGDNFPKSGVCGIRSECISLGISGNENPGGRRASAYRKGRPLRRRTTREECYLKVALRYPPNHLLFRQRKIIMLKKYHKTEKMSSRTGFHL